MAIIVIFISTCLCLLGKRIEKNWYNPLSVFCLIWATICFLANLRLFEMYAFSDKAYVVILTGIVSFFIGYMLVKNRGGVRFAFSAGKEIGFKRGCTYFSRDRLIFVSTVFVIFIYGYMAYRIASLSFSMNIAQVRTIFLRSTDEDALSMIYGSMMIKQLETLVARPMLYALIPVNTALFTERMKLSTNNILFLISLGIYCVVSSGRIIFVCFVVDLLLCFFIYGKKLSPEQKRVIKKAVKRYVIPAVILSLVVMYMLSIKRQQGKADPIPFLEQVYSYFAIPVPLLDHWIEWIDENKIMTFGVMFFKGPINALLIIGRKFGINPDLYKQAAYVLTSAEEFIKLFPNRAYNSYTSLFFAFYVDARFVGVILGSSIFGGIVSNAFIRAKTRRFEHVVFFLLVFQCVFKCFIRWEFVITSYSLAFLWLLLFIKRRRVNYEE